MILDRHQFIVDTFLYSTSSSLASNNSSSTTNSTSIFPQLVENASSIANSIFFIIIYTVLLICILGFYIKSRSEMKRNQKILFVLVGICVLVQYGGLVWRLVYNGTALHLNISYPDYDYSKVSNLEDYKIVLYVSSTFENALVLSQVINIIIVTCFIQNMFLRTVENAGAMSLKLYKIMKYLINIVSALFAIIATPLIILNAAINLATKMQVVKFDVTAIIIIIIIGFFVIIFGELLIFTILGVRLLMIVKKNSLKISQMKQNEQKTLKEILQRPYSKIVGLIIGILLTSLTQFIAGIVSYLTSNYAPYLHILDYFLQCFGILMFAVLVLLVYNPLVLSYNSENTKTNEEPQSQMSSARQPTSMRKTMSSKSIEMRHSARHHQQVTGDHHSEKEETHEEVAQVVPSDSQV